MFRTFSSSCRWKVKTFSKEFMSRHNIPTAACQNFSGYPAHLALNSIEHPIVIKASGLAAGKGSSFLTKARSDSGTQDVQFRKVWFGWRKL
jgi:phosphoribosylamine--glycine ligase/phosphoribosylformylglycinamidine cyclo-ligase